MNMAVAPPHRNNLKASIVVREKLDFKLDHHIPRYWYGNDAFMTRFLGCFCDVPRR